MPTTVTAGAKSDGTAPRPGVRALPPVQPAFDGTEALAPLPEVPGDGVISFDASDAEVEQRSVLFRIRDEEGDVTEYTVWDNPPASLGLEYLDKLRMTGANLTIPWLLEVMLGEGSFQALRDCKWVKQAGLQRVTEVCLEKVLATLGPEPPKEQDSE